MPQDAIDNPPYVSALAVCPSHVPTTHAVILTTDQSPLSPPLHNPIPIPPSLSSSPNRAVQLRAHRAGSARGVHDPEPGELLPIPPAALPTPALQPADELSFIAEGLQTRGTPSSDDLVINDLHAYRCFCTHSQNSAIRGEFNMFNELELETANAPVIIYANPAGGNDEESTRLVLRTSDCVEEVHEGSQRRAENTASDGLAGLDMDALTEELEGGRTKGADDGARSERPQQTTTNERLCVANHYPGHL
ncbi:hypothetical protein GSI_12382 [Ganoderma sinense ZZ0214-1]|uniref:Uncharacterized protein n=1 Tax=Ganoderma sinense ZZ0214-1 TaxID=1077348 RepID=A0A2G8RVN6_9APHY|nr:hypothetical protein GSI_12382 [Ganoderma sinense ZZ0214-1]